MSEETKKYRVLKPVAISGIVQPGTIVELTEADAANIGIGEYLEIVTDEVASTEVSPEAATGTVVEEPKDSEAAGEGSVETAAADTAEQIPANESGSTEDGAGGENADQPVEEPKDSEAV